jgi:hypothetical protein
MCKKIIRLFVLFNLLLSALSVSQVVASPSLSPNTSGINADYSRLPLYFIKNRGQVGERTAYYVQGHDKSLYFTPQNLTYVLAGEDSSRHWVVKQAFLDADPNVRIEGLERTSAVFSYFRGSQAQWITGLPSYAGVVYRNLWPGIDLQYRGTGSELKYQFVVQPGADPGVIQLAYRGANVRMNVSGELEVNTPLGGFRDGRPLAYQDVNGSRLPVRVTYSVLSSDENTFSYTFQLGRYDHSQPLIIDPVVFLYAGFIGGDGNDDGRGIAVDSSGNAYVTGYTTSTQTTFPDGDGFGSVTGPDLTHNGSYDAFVAKVNAAGTALLYAGYIGGGGDDYGMDIVVDGAGNAYVTGRTTSDALTFPVTVGPDLTYNSGVDTFIAKVNAAGTGLLYAGYVGGCLDDYGDDIAVDNDRNAYITGYTNSEASTFPDGDGIGTLISPDNTYNGGSFDAFVVKVNTAGTGFVYAGYIGGGEVDEGYGIAVNSAGNAFISGMAKSDQTTFPDGTGTWPLNSMDNTYNGYYDAFAARVKADGTGLDYAGYIGGSDIDEGFDIALDGSGNAYVAGYTYSTAASFPDGDGFGSLPSPDNTFNGDHDAFVAKVNTTGNALVYAGYIGGVDAEYGRGIVVDTGGNAYVAGETNSTQTTFPDGDGFGSLAGPDITHNGGKDGFIAQVNPGGTALVYASYIGGDGDDAAFDIAGDNAGSSYLVGSTLSTETTFPDGDGFGTLTGPDTTQNGSIDTFVARLGYPILTTNFRSVGVNDGWVLESTETSSVGGSINSTATTFFLGDNRADKQYRAILSFNTDSLPDSAVITSVVLKIKKQGLVGTNPFTTHQPLYVDIRKPYFGTAVTLAANDFQAAASKGSVGTFGNTPSAGWYAATLNNTAYPYINLTGTTQLRLRFKLGDDNDDFSDYMKFFSGNAGVSADKPLLIIQYYVP